MNTNAHIAETILAQLGGNMFRMMVGAHSLSYDGPKLNLKFKGSKVANYVEVKLEANDTYTVTFAKIGRGTFAPVKWMEPVEGIYADMLRRLFTETTGLYTSLR